MTTLTKRRVMYLHGREADIDPFTFIPKFTVQRLLLSLPDKQRTQLLHNAFTLLDCHPATFQKVRYAPMTPPAGKVDWSPSFDVMCRIADYFGVPLDALRNRTKQPMLLHPQLPFSNATEKVS